MRRLWAVVAAGACLLLAQPALAQFGFPRPTFSITPRPQVQQQQDICAERSAFGYATNLNQLHISCWQRKFRTGKLAADPFHPQLQFVAPQFGTGTDVYGLTDREWLELPEHELLARFLAPDRMNVILQNFRAGDLKAAVLFYLAGQLAREPFYGPGKPSVLVLAFGSAYPTCSGTSLQEPATSATCQAGFTNMIKRLQAAGIGQKIVHAGEEESWAGYALALSRSEEAKALPRARGLYAFANPDMQPYDIADADNMVSAYADGLVPIAAYLQPLGNSCSGSGYVVRAMGNRGVSLKSLTDHAIRLGNSEAARQFAGFLRDGSCGVSADRKASFRYTLKAAEMGDTKAMSEVAGLYANGDGVLENPREAIAWARKAGTPDPGWLARMEKAIGEADARLARDGAVTDVAGKAPNVATIRAVLLRELRWLYENHDMGLRNPLFAMGGGQTEWDEDNGSVRMGLTDRMGWDAANLSMRSYQAFLVDSPRCTPSGAGFSCRYSLSAVMDASLGMMKLADNVSTPFTAVTDQFVFENGRWRSPTARARMLAGLRAAPAGNAADGGKSGLCRSLNAGLVAAGGTSTSHALNPSTWGC